MGCGISIGAVRRSSIPFLSLGRVTHIIFAATGRLFFSPCQGGGSYNSFVLVSPVAGGADTIKVVVSHIRGGSVGVTSSFPILGLPRLNVTPRRCRTVRGTMGSLDRRNFRIEVRGWVVVQYTSVPTTYDLSTRWR